MACAVITNAAMIVFTMSLLDGYSAYTRFWIFIGFFWVMFIVQYIVRALIPDIPYNVQIQQQRMHYCNRKIINKEPDEDDEALMETLSSRAALKWTKKDQIALNVNGFIKSSIDQA